MHRLDLIIHFSIKTYGFRITTMKLFGVVILFINLCLVQPQAAELIDGKKEHSLHSIIALAPFGSVFQKSANAKIKAIDNTIFTTCDVYSFFADLITNISLSFKSFSSISRLFIIFCALLL